MTPTPYGEFTCQTVSELGRHAAVMIDTRMTGDFTGKPGTLELAEKIIAFVEALGPTRKEVKGQTTFAVKRKFLWMWTYGHTGDGTLYVTVLLDREITSKHFHYVRQVSANRWNHHVVVRTREQTESTWFRELIEAGYSFASK